MIDEDFEAELGPQVDIYQEVEEDKHKKLKERIHRYSIVNVCGQDLMGRPIIVISACMLPDIDEVNIRHFFYNLN